THARLGYGVARQAIGAEVQDSSNAQSSARSVARAAVTGVTPEATRRGVELVLEAEGGQDLISDSGAALQILTNLLFNAIAFTPRGRCVSLCVRESGTKVTFTVRDEGPGIASERIDSIFQGPVSTRRGGAGVGLKHSHALAIEHGGQLSVRSQHGSGASFDLTWPLCEARSSTGPQRSIVVSVRGTRVLVIEDDAAVRSLIELALEARGAQTVLVASAPELELALARGLYDVALIDLSPIADRSAQVLRRLRESNPNIAVILISGLASGVPDELEREVAAWVRKPFEMGEVLDVMARLLAERAMLESAVG
ncbi:MAG TPA: ATP-binding protein, partial [Polyangiaceae bacterium]